ncbi:MAG: hypothetical protein LIP01_15020 [Tannerellaceae bacterium]|nr:hypothetical protein [Tannerellaceae bacterium]
MFALFLYETGILILISLCVVVLLLLSFRGLIEDMTNTSFTGLFQSTNLWIPFVLILAIFFLSGYAPAHVLSSIPVTQIFRTITINKKYWKRFLLFIQFSGVTFILVLVVIILAQYKMIMDKDLGYSPDGIVYTGINVQADSAEEWGIKSEACKQEFLRLPYVADATNHYFIIIHNYSGTPVTDEEGNVLFTVRFNGVDYNYISTMGLTLVNGTNFTAADQIIVNETFVKTRGWEDDPIGKVVRGNGDTPYGTIVGVVKDYPITSLYNEQMPVMLRGFRNCGGMLTLRVTDFSSEKLTELNDKLATMFPDQIKEFTVLQNQLASQYNSTRQFRDSVVAAFLIVLLITAMGLFGYISDEITRRSKEIAIRKVNGATAPNILTLLYKDISYLSLPAVILGILISIYMGRKWLEDFAVKISLSPQMFILSAIGILLLITGIVTLRAWRVANENPVDSIKSE